MKRLIYLWSLFVLISTFRVPLLASERGTRFTKLPNGDTIRMVYRSQGCFGGSSYELLFKRGTDFSVTISSLTIRPAYEDRPAQTNTTLIGEVKLSEAELRGLDKLLMFYLSL